MKKYTYILSIAFLLSGTGVVLASPPPVLTLSNNGTSVQVIVTGADANAPVQFYYPMSGQSGGSSPAYSSVNIGQTDAYGSLTTSINAGSYALVTGNPVYVSVDGIQSANLAWPSLSNAAPATLVLSQTAATLSMGQSITVNANNVSGTLSVPGNTNPSVLNVTLNGNSVILSGQSSGNAVVTVCASGSGCSNVNVTVQPSYLGTSGVTLVPNNISISSGQTQNISITGYATGPYYVSNNTGSNTVSTSVNGSTLLVSGLGNGSSNITVCASSGQCGTVFVNVSASIPVVSAPVSSGTTVLSNQPPVLSSVTVSSNDASGAFVGSGNAITISIMANQTINSPTVSVAGTSLTTNGSGSGPYIASYAVTGREALPLPVVITFSNPAGQSGQTYLWAGNSAAGAPSTANTATVVNAVPSVTPTPAAPAAPSAPASYVFSRYLYAGMTAPGVSDPDVAALQDRLKADGFFTGPLSGYFGLQTKIALEAYQKKHSLTAIGVVGPSTRALLNQGI